MEFLKSQSSDIFESEINLLKEDLIAKHIELGMRSSGKWAENLETIIEVTENNFRAIFKGLNYTEQLVQGREPGRFPPRKSIIEWISSKPITPNDNISIESLAFLIARKIATVGTDYYMQGGTDLIEAVFTTERIKSIIEKMGLLILSNFEQEINELLLR